MIVNGLVSFEEFSWYDQNEERYANTFKNKNNILEGFIHWNNKESYLWAPPWNNDHVLVTVRDHSTLPNLVSTTDLFKSMREWAEYSAFNIPGRLYYQREARNKVSGWTYSRTHIAKEEIDVLISQMTDEEMCDYRVRIEKDFVSSVKEILSRPSIENPYFVHISGRDDTSYGRAFPTEKVAIDAVRALILFPNQDVMLRMGFVFTN